MLKDIIEERQRAVHKSYQEAYKGILSPETLAVRNTWYEKEIAETAQIVAREVLRIVDRHCAWRPTEGYDSEEEKGFQKGLIAEAKLIRKDILEAFPGL